VIPFEQPIAEMPPPRPLPSHSVAALDPSPHVAKPEPQPRLIIPKKKPVIAKEGKPENVQAKQEVLQFEPISRGRFEKSEPTIVEGQDLDVPTFLRKNIRVK
jgi:cell division protein FtsZ